MLVSPVKLLLGPLWNMALWKFGFVVREETSNTRKSDNLNYSSASMVGKKVHGKDTVQLDSIKK